MTSADLVRPLVVTPTAPRRMQVPPTEPDALPAGPGRLPTARACATPDADPEPLHRYEDQLVTGPDAVGVVAGSHHTAPRTASATQRAAVARA